MPLPHPSFPSALLLHCRFRLRSRSKKVKAAISPRPSGIPTPRPTAWLRESWLDDKLVALEVAQDVDPDAEADVALVKEIGAGTFCRMVATGGMEKLPSRQLLSPGVWVARWNDSPASRIPYSPGRESDCDSLAERRYPQLLQIVGQAVAPHV